MANFSDYIVFVDESGDHSMSSIDETYPVFVLACCLISKRDYMNVVVPAVQRIKFATFGHDAVVLHERDIRKDLGPFSVLRDEQKKRAFLDDKLARWEGDEMPKSVADLNRAAAERTLGKMPEADDPGVLGWFVDLFKKP